MAVKRRILFEETAFKGPYELDTDFVGELDDEDFGVYVIVTLDRNEDWGAVYVGRGWFRERMTAHTKRYDGEGVYLKKLRSEPAAFREECRLYHAYGKKKHLDNLIHPPVPTGSGPNVKRCSERGCNGEP
jgi:hypothetical protein